MGPHVPRASWEAAPSELPNHPGLAPWTPERERRGLFTVLIQNAAARVRRLVGRYLWIRIDLHGDGRSGPDICALRAYGSRFDYAERYLARLYREVVYGAAADSPGELVHRLDASHALVLDTAALFRRHSPPSCRRPARKPRCRWCASSSAANAGC